MKKTKETTTKETYNKAIIRKIIKTFFPPFFILVIHTLLSYVDAYHIYDWVDIPMHFFGGVSVGIMYTLIIKELQASKHINYLRPTFYFVIVLSLVGTTAVGWELYEFIWDFFFHIGGQPSLADTMIDMILGLVGGVCGFLYTISKRI